LQSDAAVCVDGVTIQDAQGKEVKSTYRVSKPDELEVKVALKEQAAGPLKLKLKQYGLQQNDEVALRAYAEAAHLDAFQINAGDQQGVLKGTRLDEVAQFELNGVRFVPAKLTRANEQDELHLAATSDNAAPVTLEADQRLVAHVALKDGRVLDLPTIIGTARPKMTLVNKTIQPGATPTAITLTGEDVLPLDGQISFLLKTEIPVRLTRSE